MAKDFGLKEGTIDALLDQNVDSVTALHCKNAA